jgi:ferritin-like metal-binding protein YciE
MNDAHFQELLLQALEHEMGGVKVYEAAIDCAVNDDLKQEWQKYLQQTRNHVRLLEAVCATRKIDPKHSTPGRKIVGQLGQSLVAAMKQALAAGDPEAAQLVAGDCVTLAETKDHFNWGLLGECARHMTGAGKHELAEAYDEVEEQEDEHLYHSKGWTRELWAEALGLKAQLPPPEEKRNVRSATAEARVEKESRAKH